MIESLTDLNSFIYGHSALFQKFHNKSIIRQSRMSLQLMYCDQALAIVSVRPINQNVKKNIGT